MAEKPWYHTVVIPAGTYDGCDEDITTFAQYTALCARADVPEETVYNLDQDHDGERRCSGSRA